MIIADSLFHTSIDISSSLHQDICRDSYILHTVDTDVVAALAHLTKRTSHLSRINLN